MATQKGIITSQAIPQSGRSFQVADSPPPCYQDRWSGEWMCGHSHGSETPLQDAYQHFEGWTAQHYL